MTSDQERAAPAQQPVADKPLRYCDYCKSWYSKPCGAGCVWRPDMPTELPPSSEPELRAEIVRLTRERDEARGIVSDIHWMAVRYADNRKSYAVGMCNDALRKAYDGGWLVYRADTQRDLDPQYARDGMFDAEWRSAVDAATARAEAAESRIETLSAEVGTARAAAFEEAAQIAEKFKRKKIGVKSETWDPCGRWDRTHHYEEGHERDLIASAIRSRAALDKGAMT